MISKPTVESIYTTFVYTATIRYIQICYCETAIPKFREVIKAIDHMSSYGSHDWSMSKHIQKVKTTTSMAKEGGISDKFEKERKQFEGK